MSVYSYYFAYSPLNEFRPISFKETREILIFLASMALFCTNKSPNGVTLPRKFFNILDLGYFGPKGAVKVKQHVPHMYDYVYQCYANEYSLYFGSQDIINS